MVTKKETTKENYMGAVLLSDHIEKWRERGFLIVEDPCYKINHYPEYQDIGDTFDEQQLDRAKYNVRLGVTYFKHGKFDHFDASLHNNTLTIEPYELIFVESYEVFNMPGNIIGMYDLRRSSCLAGLELQTGLHIDPGYYGRLFCPLFNFSDRETILEYKDQLASIQFIYTTPPTHTTKPFTGSNRLFCLRQGIRYPQGTGLEILRKDLKDFHEESNRLNMRVDSMVSSNFNAMAFIIGALAVLASAVTIAVTRQSEGADIYLAIGIFIVIILIGSPILYPMIREKFHKKTIENSQHKEKKEQNGGTTEKRK